MDNDLHDSYVEYHRNGTEPKKEDLSSTPTNFRKGAKKYTLKGDRLLRDGKVVITQNELPELFETHHVGTLHNGTLSGRTYFWGEVCTKLGRE